MMQLHVGLDFDGLVYAPPAPARQGVVYAGPRKLLQWLESHLGCGGYPSNPEYLRIELYRQALQRHLAEWEANPLFGEAPFYRVSFQSDRFATAVVLLDMRDALVSAGWDFEAEPLMPARLGVFAAVEALFSNKLEDPALGIAACGVVDRYRKLMHRLAKHRTLPPVRVVLHDLPEHQPPHWKRLWAVLEKAGWTFEQAPEPEGAPEDAHLGWLQRLLRREVSGRKSARPVHEDASLLVVRARRDSDAACWLAQLLDRNPALDPVVLLPQMNHLLENALLHEDKPAMGVLSTSLARPSLQVLKLAPAFLWEPVDVFKIMEFATLPVKPLEEGLALEIARVLAEKPGLFSDTWFGAVFGYLERAEVPAEARRHYEFWFERRRYPSDGTAPKRDAVALYAFLQEWARRQYEQGNNKNGSLLVLAEQARRIKELLDTLPETRLTFLELERIVRTIYEPSPAGLNPAEAGKTDFFHQPGAVAASMPTLIWWNCLFSDTSPAPDRWRAAEQQWLESRQCAPLHPRTESARMRQAAQRPLEYATRQVVLVVPEYAEGVEATPGLLLGDLEAAFDTCAPFTFHLDDEADCARLAAALALPARSWVDLRPSGNPRPQLDLRCPELVLPGEYETPTQLQNLFYYPHQWFFRQKLRLFPPSLLGLTDEQALLGNLSHRFFEMLLKEDIGGMDKHAISDWIREKAPDLFEREGATLLMYGREPERNAFLHKVRDAAWSLVSLLRSNGWTVEETEKPLEGMFCGMAVRGKADLVLVRGEERAIVDLKWSGARRRREMIRNQEDLQLVLYARLLAPEGRWPHTAYFILEDAKMVARNNAAFREALATDPGTDQEEVCRLIFDKMEKTYRWRMAQLERGALELRNRRTAEQLEALYQGENLADLLEMKREDSRWDDYALLLAFS